MTLYYYGIDYNIGGLEVFGKNLISFVRKHRPDIHIVILAAYPTIAFEDYFVELGCNIVHLPPKGKNPLRYYRALVSALSHHAEGDIFQINACSYRNYLLFKAAKKAGIETIVVAHVARSDNFLENIVHRAFRRRFARLGYKVAVSESAKEFMYGRKSRDVKIITNGIDFERFSFSAEKRNEMRKKLGVGDDEILIAHIGRISKQKNQLFSLEVMKESLQHNPKVCCVFFGDVNDKDMGDVIRSSQNERIRLFPPDAEGIDAIYDALDVLFVPSIAEGGLSFVAVEAARSGTQVFMNESLGRIEGNHPNVHYLPLDKDAWVRELGKVELLSLVGARRTQDLPAIYSLDHSLEQYLELYGDSYPVDTLK